MKIIQNDKGFVQATAESLEESRNLLALAVNPRSKRADIRVALITDDKKVDTKKVKHKKHLYRKICPECSKTFKGNHGLGIHRARIHGVGGVVAKREHEKTKKELGFMRPARTFEPLPN